MSSTWIQESLIPTYVAYLVLCSSLRISRVNITSNMSRISVLIFLLNLLICNKYSILLLNNSWNIDLLEIYIISLIQRRKLELRANITSNLNVVRRTAPTTWSKAPSRSRSGRYARTSPTLRRPRASNMLLCCGRPTPSGSVALPKT